MSGHRSQQIVNVNNWLPFGRGRITAVLAVENGAARTPPMGWNTWNTFGCDISESLIRQTVDALAGNGMAALGYRYVVVDDCWFDPSRDAQGDLQAHPARFPSGMKALGDYIHSKGLKFGIYQVPVDKSCAQYFNTFAGATGSQGHEEQDVRQFAAWGFDYLKYDWCSPKGTMDEQVAAFAKMRDVANMWRTTEDITDRWDTGSDGSSFMGVQNIINVNVSLASYASPGGFNDPDMLEVGNGGMTDTEQRSHFAIWAMMAAPLIAGNDVRSASAGTLSTLKNADLVAVDQDPLGLQAIQVSNDRTRRVTAKRLANGDVAVARGGISAIVPPRGTAVFRVSGGGLAPAPATFPLRGEPAGRCLDSPKGATANNGTANGTPAIVWTCHGAANQRWIRST